MRTTLLAVLLVGCGDDDIRVEGPHYQYVMSSLKIPMNTIGARDNGLDLNADKSVDNQLGMVFGTLKSFRLGVDETAQEAVLRGGLVLLADLQTPNFELSPASGLQTYLGRDPMPAPCLDPSSLATCGQHLLGTGRFTIEPDSGSDHGIAPISQGVFTAGMGLLPVEIALDVNAPLRLDLHAARIRFTWISEAGFAGVIGGAITKEDVDRVILPQAAHEIERIVGAECGKPAGNPPCGCIEGSRAEVLQKFFDKDKSCDVTLTEVATNDLVKSLLTPDIQVNGEMGLSFGVGVEFRAATFQ